MPKLDGENSPHPGSGMGSPGTSRPTYSVRSQNPEKWRRMLLLAARARLEGRSYMEAARESGIPYSTLVSWQRRSTSKQARQWKAILEEQAQVYKVNVDGTPDEKPAPALVVTTEGFETPEQLADAWSLEATKVQIETMIDPKAGRKERVDAAKRIQDLGGHSPVSKSVVISAPLDDPRVAKGLLAVLEEIKFLEAKPPPKLIEGEILSD